MRTVALTPGLQSWQGVGGATALCCLLPAASSALGHLPAGPYESRVGIVDGQGLLAGCWNGEDDLCVLYVGPGIDRIAVPACVGRDGFDVATGLAG